MDRPIPTLAEYRVSVEKVYRDAQALLGLTGAKRYMRVLFAHLDRCAMNKTHLVNLVHEAGRMFNAN